MKQLKEISLEELLSKFDGEAKIKVKELSTLPEADALVVFEIRDFASPSYPKRTVVAVGENLTHKSVSELKGSWINEGDNRQDATSFCILTK